MIIDEFRVQNTLYHGNHIVICRALKEPGEVPYILKILDKKATALQVNDVLKTLRREYNFIRRIDSPFVIKTEVFLDNKDYAAIVMEDFQGKQLKELIPPGGLESEDVVRLAMDITAGLSAIHRQNIIHKDINPGNIVMDHLNGHLKIIDFDISSQFDVKVAYLSNPEKLEGTLPYISPEQTGRVNRRVDHRTDLYSLGISLYELATGELPFRHESPLEIVYDHLARDPDPPHLINRRIPAILSALILKLMAKSPEDRYQSAAGVWHDLQTIRQNLALRNKVYFDLGQKDFSGKLNIPETLYGREKEILQLMDVYKGIRTGHGGLVLIAGYAGTGKTSLVHEIHKPIVKDHGYFINGKFDQMQRTQPYSAFIQALDHFCQLLLSERQDVLNIWKKQILDKIGKLGQLLIQLIPRLKHVIGPQPNVPAMGGREAKKRFNYVFQRFIKAIASAEHPLVMFIDDLQWADLASLELLQLLVEDRQNHHLMFIGAYRNSEVNGAHPLMTTIEQIANQNIKIHRIHVKNLSLVHVTQWLSDTLSTSGNEISTDEIKPFAGLIYEKTRGNAFFTAQFLTNLYENQLLRFDYARSRWVWDVEDIAGQHITENVVDLLVQKIRTFPGQTQHILKMAASIGNAFDLHTLQIISNQPREQIEKRLETAQFEHLIYPTDRDGFKFVHDRIRQAAYSLIPDEDKKKLHLEIGRLLLSKHTDDRGQYTGQFLFDIVNHLNTGNDLLDNQKEKLRLARLNLESSLQAKVSGAYKLAADYISTALKLLPDTCWNTHYDLTLAVYNEALQTSYLCGNFAGMKAYVESVLAHANDISHTSAAHEHRLMSMIAQGKPLLALETLLTIFNRLGVHIEPKVSKRLTAETLKNTAELMEAKGIENIKNLNAMEDHAISLVIRLYYIGGAAFAYAAQDVVLYVTARLVALILERGLPPESPHVLSAYGSKMIHLGDIPGAYSLGETALELLERGIGSEAIKIRTLVVIHAYLLGNKKHFHQVCRDMTRNYLHALDVGDIEMVGYIVTNYIMCLSRTDTPIEQVHEKALTMRNTVVELKQSMLIAPLLIEISYCAAMLGQTRDPATPDTSELDAMFQNMHEDTRRIYSWQVNIKKIILAYLFDRFQNMAAFIKEAEECWNHLTSPITYIKSDYYFFIPLAYLKMCGRTTDKKERKKLLTRVRKSIKIMKQWADIGPVNFLHKYYLIQAEYYRVTSKHRLAEEWYDKAIKKALENEYINDAAVANECAARYYIEQNQFKLAAISMIDANKCYQKWGAAAKIQDLKEKFPKYLDTPTTTPSFIDRTASAANTKFLDVKSILKASQTLSGEVQLKGLLEKMMQILIENAGARKSLLIRQQDNRLLIQAEGGIDGVSSVLQNIPVEKSGKVPMSVINFVANDNTPLVFDNLSRDATFGHDPYILDHQPKSVACLPISKHGIISLIIYLEHGQVEGTFTPARMEVLNMLSAQIAISVENTELVENLEEKVKQRTEALRETHRQLERNHRDLEESHRKINDSVNYASRIQEAVLPSRETFSEFFPNHFLIYWPCSTVSGDFYWIKQVGKQIMVAAADCTGHGVPGAFVSMLGMAFLNEIVLQLAMIEMTAAEILELLRNQVKTALGQKDARHQQKEGLDIALCIIDPQKQELQYAGAYNPLYLIRDGDLTEIKADRMPIGIYRKEKPFTNHQITYRKDDMLYLFSDGYPDQNGDDEDGEAKFTKKRFKDLLIDISSQPVTQQELILTRRFDQFKGSQPQRDDVLVIGIRL